MDVYNGEKEVVFRASFARPKVGAEVLRELAIRGIGIGKPIMAESLAPLDGLYWPGSATWLPDLLSSSASWKLDGFESINGINCVRISGRPFETTVGDDWVETLWIDPAHDFLVRRYLASGQISAKKDYIVDEFQKMPNGLWFPKRGRIQLQSNPYENQLWVVTEATMNGSINDPRFAVPEPEIGTIVDSNGRVFQKGMSPRTTEAKNSTNSGQMQKDMSPVSNLAKLPTSQWFAWSIALAMVSVFFLIVGLWFRHKQKGSKS